MQEHSNSPNSFNFNFGNSMDPLTIASLGIGVLGQGASIIGQKAADRRYRETMMDLQHLTNQQNVDFWNMQNAYNTPLEQMRRLKEAGLNPNLMYGKGTTGNAVQIAPSKRPDTRFTNLMATIPDAILRTAEVSRVIADIKQKQTVTAGLKEDNRQKARDNEIGEALKDWLISGGKAESESKGYRRDIDRAEAKDADRRWQNFTDESTHQMNLIKAKRTSAEKQAEIDKIIHGFVKLLKDGTISAMEDPAEALKWFGQLLMMPTLGLGPQLPQLNTYFD
jgi:hypothetical protein